jgi:hypothetical protein
MPYHLGGKVFPTKKAVTEHVRSVREKTPIGRAVVDAPVLDLLQRHPNWDEKTDGGAGYPGCTMVSFSSNIRPSKEIAILFPDGRPAMDISWKKVVDRLKPDGSLREIASGMEKLDYLREACRNGISNQLLPLYRPGHHVDHVFPKTFEVLLFQWVQALGRPVSQIPVVDVHGTVELGKQIADDELLAEWQAFHEKHAELEVVSAAENLSRPKVRLDWTPLL